MSTPKFTAPETPVTREEVYYDAILRGLNGDSPAPVIPTPVWRMEEYLAAIAEAASSGGGGSSLPSVTPADNGKVLAVDGLGNWGAYFPDNSDRRIVINATLGNDGDLTTTTTITYGEAIMLIGGCYLYVDIYNTDSQLIQSIQMQTICQNMLPEYLFYEGQYLDVFGNSARHLFAYFAFPSSEDARATVYLQWKQNKFIVTLTPTALDYSGTMDKTPAEIAEAYNAGQEIVFYIPSLGAEINATQFLLVNDALVAGGMVFYMVNGSPVIITIATDRSASTYATQIFAMTPAS